MGPGHTLQTKAVLDGQTVTLVGGGDVLLADDAGDPTATAGHAGLGDLARATAEKLKSQGVTSVSLRLDDTLFTGPQWNEKWEAGNEQYVAKIQPIMVDVSATQNQGYPEDPAMEAAQAFAKHLSEAGITVDGEPTRAAASGSAREVASVSSAPLSDILSVSLKTSDNTMTEVEGRLVAAHAKETTDFAGASKAVLAQLSKDGFDTSGVTLLDSSGLAKGNKVPARLLTQIMTKAPEARAARPGAPSSPTCPSAPWTAPWASVCMTPPQPGRCAPRPARWSRPPPWRGSSPPPTGASWPSRSWPIISPPAPARRSQPRSTTTSWRPWPRADARKGRGGVFSAAATGRGSGSPVNSARKVSR